MRPAGSGAAQVRSYYLYSVSKPWLVKRRVRQFSVTVRMMSSRMPPGASTSISSVTRAFAPSSAVRWATTSLATVSASRLRRVELRPTVPWKRRTGRGAGAGGVLGAVTPRPGSPTPLVPAPPETA